MRILFFVFTGLYLSLIAKAQTLPANFLDKILEEKAAAAWKVILEKPDT